MQEEICSLYKVIDNADLTKAELQEQMDHMRVELRSLEHKHEQVKGQNHHKPPFNH